MKKLLLAAVILACADSPPPRKYRTQWHPERYVNGMWVRLPPNPGSLRIPENKWPKRCPACGHEYTPEEWVKLPPPTNGNYSCDDYAEWDWRNCNQLVDDGRGGLRPCNSTMMVITEIRDRSAE